MLFRHHFLVSNLLKADRLKGECMNFIDWARLGMGSSVNLEHMAHPYLLQQSLSSAPAESAVPISYCSGLLYPLSVGHFVLTQ